MKHSFILISVLSALLLVAGTPETGIAQADNRYNMANRLYQQGEYRKALPLFRQLYREQPGTYLFLERATECLINLNRYEEAISFTKNAINNNHHPGQSSVLLGRIYHVSGDTVRAYSLWDETIEQYPGHFQIYLLIGRAMVNRRSFDRAIEVYRKAQSRFSGSTLLSTELAGTYMQAGKYEEAVNEFLELVKQEPNRTDYVQRTLMRFEDQYLYDTAIVEIKKVLDNLPLRHSSYRNLHQLQLWLLMERNLYERALAAAKAYESRSSQNTYTLYDLASKLLSARKFELAEKAYKFYIGNNNPSTKYRSMEELAKVYIQWGEYLKNYNLATSIRRDSLYQQAFSTLDQIVEEAPFYNQMGRVLITQADLALKHMHDVDRAEQYLQKLKTLDGRERTAQRMYLEGRIKLYEGNYDRARILFRRSSKEKQSGSLSEETNYYSALSDFYGGEYEFAKIQLKSLERQGTSYFANDALQLRIWIQEGMQDSSTALLDPFAQAVEMLNHGNTIRALEKFKKMSADQSFHPLTDDLLLELGENITPQITTLVYSLTNRYLNRWGNSSPLQERLLWEKAQIADRVVTQGDSYYDKQEEVSYEIKSIFEYSQWYNPAQLPSSRQELISLYEDILLKFPDGFYASYARTRIQELKELQT